MIWRLLATSLVGSLVVAGAERARAEAATTGARGQHRRPRRSTGAGARARAAGYAARLASAAGWPDWQRRSQARRLRDSVLWRRLRPRPDAEAEGGSVPPATQPRVAIPLHELDGGHHTYVTHLGVERQVLRRNDVQLTRDVFYFSGFAFDPRLDFNILIYTSSATLSATAAGFAGYVFNRAFALRAGFFSLPSTRSMTGTYPFFHSTDRSMANNYMRPGFTQGVWANGELFPGFNYIAMIGNSLNTLDIAATKIDFNFAYAASIWYDLHDFGKEWNDYDRHEELAVRVGTAFTFSREDRLSDLSTSSPENNATFISDGTLLFETGSLAPGVTVSLANFYLWAIDVGLKYRGLAFNAELYQRWLNSFDADGPLPINSMFDWGLEASLGYFVLKKRLETYRAHVTHPGAICQADRGCDWLQLVPVPHAPRLAERRSHRNSRISLSERPLRLFLGSDGRAVPGSVSVAVLSARRGEYSPRNPFCGMEACA